MSLIPLPSVEGCMTLVFSVISMCVSVPTHCSSPPDIDTSFILPDFPANTKWLTEEERRYAVARLAKDDNIDSADDQAVGHWRSIVLAVKDWRAWLFCFGQSTCTAAGTITYFIPTLTASLGYSGRKAQFVGPTLEGGNEPIQLTLTHS